VPTFQSYLKGIKSEIEEIDVTQLRPLVGPKGPPGDVRKTR